MDETQMLCYLTWQEKYLVEKPYQVYGPLPAGMPEGTATNLVFDLCEPEVIRDIRGSSTNFTLDEHGFTVCSMDTSPHPLSKTEIINDYIPKTCELVRKAVNAECVVAFDWKIRKSAISIETLVNNPNQQLPTLRVHIDQTPVSAKQCVKAHAPEELHRFQTGRVQIIK